MPDPKKILFVDDDLDHLSICKLILTHRGFNVLVLWNCHVLLEVVKDFMPDIIFMDHSMPEITGIEATQMLKAAEESKHIPVIYFTAQENIKDLAKAAGADGFLEKPFKIDRMLEVAAPFI